MLKTKTFTHYGSSPQAVADQVTAQVNQLLAICEIDGSTEVDVHPQIPAMGVATGNVLIFLTSQTVVWEPAAER